jgi:hypothetical protein
MEEAEIGRCLCRPLGAGQPHTRAAPQRQLRELSNFGQEGASERFMPRSVALPTCERLCRGLFVTLPSLPVSGAVARWHSGAGKRQGTAGQSRMNTTPQHHSRLVCYANRFQSTEVTGEDGPTTRHRSRLRPHPTATPFAAILQETTTRASSGFLRRYAFNKNRSTNTKTCSLS